MPSLPEKGGEEPAETTEEQEKSNKIENDLLFNLFSIYHPQYIWLPNDKVSLFDGDTIYTYYGYSLIKTKYENSAMTIDGYALPESPYEIYRKGNNNEVALLNGVNAGEADPFIFLEYLFGEQPNLKNYKERLQSIFGDDTDTLLA